MKKIKESKREGISDAMVLTATGKKWEKWYAILDKVNAAKLPHTEIARYLYIHHLENKGWWCQMIANRYEQERGLQKKQKKPVEFQISISEAYDMPITYIYAAWMEENARKRWLKEVGMDFTSVIPNTSIRMIWNDKKTHVAVDFIEIGSKKTQVELVHGIFSQEVEVDKMKEYWRKKLRKFSEYLSNK
jgi:hypothetical protein